MRQYLTLYIGDQHTFHILIAAIARCGGVNCILIPSSGNITFPSTKLYWSTEYNLLQEHSPCVDRMLRTKGRASAVWNGTRATKTSK